MAEGYLAPVIWTVLDASGNPVSGALINSYRAGTTTRLDTFTTSALSVANANPIVCDSAGRAQFFLTPGVAYKFIVTDSAGASIGYPTMDNIMSYGLPSSRLLCQGRLTGTTGNAVVDTASSTTIYFTPYHGNQIGLYDGTSWSVLTFAELSIALGADTIDKNYDVFAYNNNGAAAIERLIWTNNTTRATALTTQDGILVKSGDATRRYLGTYRTVGAGTTTDTASQRFIWNYYNRVLRYLLRQESTDSWTYTTATYRQANNSASNQVAVVVGVAEVSIALELQVHASNTNANASLVVAIGADATTGPGTGGNPGLVDTTTANARIQWRATLNAQPTVGYHFYPWLEYSTAVGTTTWLGDAGAPTLLQSGLYGSLAG